MKILSIAVACAAAVVAAPAALANGGGYESGGVAATGAVKGFEPEQTGKVRIRDENLSIRLHPKEALVEVRYVLKNTSTEAANVKFGFPIEETPDADFGEDLVPGAVAKRKSPLFLQDYRVTINGAPVKAVYQKEPPRENDERFKELAGWMVSEVRFRPGEERTMTISYGAKYPLSYFSVSDDESMSAKAFVYRLSTGAAWEGPIERGRVVVESENDMLTEVRVDKPLNKFRREGNRWIWDFEDLEPTLADDIKVIVEPAYRTYGDFIERDDKWSVRHRNYSVKASSTLAPQGKHSYDAENLQKGDWDQVWAEGAKGNGAGEWLEIIPEVPAQLRALWIYPGFASDEDKYKANGRPRKVEVVLNDSYKFEAELDDKAEYQPIRIPSYDKRVEKVKITMKSASPGTRFEDLCITTIALETSLAKKPKILPAR
jgi:hypothetical protein